MAKRVTKEPTKEPTKAPTKKPAKNVGAKAAKVKAAGAGRATASKVKLLTGGNPQIAKGDGDAPVQAYIDAMPGWKSAVGRQLDALIERVVPGVSKAVRWNSPFYGVAGQGWFLGHHTCAKYIKVAFFKGSALTPLPPIASKHKDVRYVHIFENEPFDPAQMEAWVRQAAAIPGADCF